MGKVSVTINGRAFTIGCEEGQEAYLRDLARHLDGHIRDLSGQVGQIGDLRLLLMASLVVADERREAVRRTEALEAEIETLKAADKGRSDSAKSDRDRLAQSLNRAAERLEALAAAADT